jgi:hypothetical protein
VWAGGFEVVEFGAVEFDSGLSPMVMGNCSLSPDCCMPLAFQSAKSCQKLARRMVSVKDIAVAEVFAVAEAVAVAEVAEVEISVAEVAVAEVAVAEVAVAEVAVAAAAEAGTEVEAESLEPVQSESPKCSPLSRCSHSN